MKKILALVMALAMVLCAASVLAEGSKTIDDTQQANVAPVNWAANVAEEEALSLKILDEATEESQVVLDAFKAALTLVMC